MTRRKLTSEEIELWRKVAKQAERLHPEIAADGASDLCRNPSPRKRRNRVFRHSNLARCPSVETETE